MCGRIPYDEENFMFNVKQNGRTVKNEDRKSDAAYRYAGS